MGDEFSTPPAKSQALTADTEITSTKPNLHFYWLVVSALLWGPPFLLLYYFPVLTLELLLPRSRLRTALRNSRKKYYTKMLYSYMCLQPFYKTQYDLAELRKLEEQDEKFLMVANHRSHLDVFLLISQIDGLQLLAKKALFSVPILHIMMRATRQIPAEKGDWKSLETAIATIESRIQDKERVLIFPEFKRCDGGFKGINSFSLLPFQLAIKSKVKILILVVSGTDDVWPKGSLHLRNPPTPQRVVALPPVDSAQYTSAKELRDKVHSLAQNKYLEQVREVSHEV